MHPAARPVAPRTGTESEALSAVALPAAAALDPNVIAALRAAMETAAEYEAAHRASNTRSNYGYSWTLFDEWCRTLGVCPLPVDPEILGIYIGHLAITGGRDRKIDGSPAGRRAGTVIQHVTAIQAHHKDNGLADPTKNPLVQRILRGLKRTKGIRPDRREPMTLARLFKVIDTIDQHALITLRDRVIICADAVSTRDGGPITAAQLARMSWSDVRLNDRDLVLRLPAKSRSKTRTETILRETSDPLCLVAALRTLAAELMSRSPRPEQQARQLPSGPLLPNLDRHGNLQSGAPTRAAIATRLARAADSIGVDCNRQAAPAWDDAQRQVALDAISRPKLADLRDRALLLLGFALAARRSNLSILTVGEIEHRPEGLLVTFRRSKTDQEGAGRVLAVPRKGGNYCPVSAWENWFAAMSRDLGSHPGDHYPAFPALDASGTRVAGPRPVYETHNGTPIAGDDGQCVVSHWEGICGDEINRIVQRRAKAARLATDPESGRQLRWGGHSLRRGWMTEAARQGISLELMMAHSGHVTTDVALEYIAEAKKFDPEHSAAMRLQFDLHPAVAAADDAQASEEPVRQVPARPVVSPLFAAIADEASKSVRVAS